MSLKVFHLVFISVCILLSLFVGVWGIAEHHYVLAALFLAAGGVLLVYGRQAFQKLKEIH
jgi:hypothetical protein